VQPIELCRGERVQIRIAKAPVVLQEEIAGQGEIHENVGALNLKNAKGQGEEKQNGAKNPGFKSHPFRMP
jgi:hypothetical protein